MWYYANAGRQEGPVNEADFKVLTQNGTITSNTLVWREGMTDWALFSTLQTPAIGTGLPPIQPGAAVPPGQVQCAECRRFFTPDEVIQIHHRSICANCKPMFLQKLQEGAFSASTAPVQGMVYAEFWQRAVAYIIDYVILQTIQWIFVVPAFFIMGYMGSRGGGASGAMSGAMLLFQIAVSLGSMLLAMTYTVFFLRRYAATPGKMVFKLVVVRANGSRLTTGRCFARYFASVLSALVCCIGYLLPLFDEPMRRALHDHLCDTRVIIKPPAF
jgi:uncharacterized RDD family membrane protein YckC